MQYSRQPLLKEDASSSSIFGLLSTIGLGVVLLIALSSALQGAPALEARVTGVVKPSTIVADARPIFSHHERHTRSEAPRYIIPQAAPQGIAVSDRRPKQPDAFSGPMFAVVAALCAFLGAGVVPAIAKSRTSSRSTVALAAVSGSPSYKLRYFDARGVAEISRYLFAIAGVPYEDFRYKFTFGVPGDFKTISMPEFHADRDGGVLDPNMGRLPLLEVDGVPIGQSKAIERYLARQFGMLGENELEAALIDTICEHTRDIKDGYRKLTTIQNPEEKQAAMAKWYAEELPQWCARLEKCVEPSPGYAIGSKLSLADVNIWALMTDFFPDREATAKALAPCARLTAICKGISALEGVQKWLQNRPPTMM